MVEIPIRTLKMAAEITLKDFWHLCNQHYWSFEFSDDHRHWTRGRAQRAELKRVLDYQKDKDHRYRNVYDAFNLWAFDTMGDQTKPEEPK